MSERTSTSSLRPSGLEGDEVNMIYFMVRGDASFDSYCPPSKMLAISTSDRGIRVGDHFGVIDIPSSVRFIQLKNRNSPSKNGLTRKISFRGS